MQGEGTQKKKTIHYQTMATALLSYHLVFVALWSQFIVLYDVMGVLLLCGDVQLNP